MINAYIGPDPEARSLRPGIINQDVMDALAHALQCSAFTSAEVHREAGLEDLLHGNGRVVGQDQYHTHRPILAGLNTCAAVTLVAARDARGYLRICATASRKGGLSPPGTLAGAVHNEIRAGRTFGGARTAPARCGRPGYPRRR